MSTASATKRKLAETIHNIRKKYKSIKHSRAVNEDNVGRIFTPLTEYLEDLKKKIPTSFPITITHHKKEEPSKEEKHESNSRPKLYGRKDNPKIVEFTRSTVSSIPTYDKIQDEKKHQELMEHKEEIYEDTAEADESISGEIDENDGDDEDYHQNTTAEMNITQEALDDYLESYPPTIRPYVEGYWLNETGYDKSSYGLQLNAVTEKWLLGNTELKFNSHQNTIDIKGESFEGTPGLCELLFKSEPNVQHITPTDLLNFGKIIHLTNLIFRGYDATKQKRGMNSVKYKEFVRQAYDQYMQELNRPGTPKSSKSSKTVIRLKPQTLSQKKSKTMIGMGHNNHLYNTKPMEYIYFDNVNELVSRLELLHASVRAGNISHINEIRSIEEELRELNIIA